MFICPLCSDVVVRALSQLMTHIRLVHADDPHFIIQCSFQGCTRTFRKFTVYRNHVYSFHDTTVLDTPETSIVDMREHMDTPDCKLVHQSCMSIHVPVLAMPPPLDMHVITIPRLLNLIPTPNYATPYSSILLHRPYRR